MSEEPAKEVVHFNRGTVWGRVDGAPKEKLSDEGKGKLFWRMKVICASHRGNAFAFGRLWDEKKAKALIEYLKKNPGAGVKLVGWFNQYDKMLEGGKTERRSNYTWHDWYRDECPDPRAAFSLVGVVTGLQGDILSLNLQRKNCKPEDFKIHALDEISLQRLTEGDVVQVKGYLRSKSGEDEFGDTDNSPIMPYFADADLKIRAAKTPF